MTCARCGASDCGVFLTDVKSTKGFNALDIIACRDRQIAAQAALLRSVTGKLEEAAGELASRNDDRLLRPLTLINSALEMLA